MTPPAPPEDFLYPGPDLLRAAERSRIRPVLRDRFIGLRNGAGVLAGIVSRRVRQRKDARLEMVVATCTNADATETLSAAYAGPGDNSSWCLGNVLGDYAEVERVPAKDPGELLRLVRGIRRNVDVVFTEGVSTTLGANREVAFLAMPAWIKQRVRLLDDWPAQMNGLRRETRQETGRYLRKYGFGATLSRDPQAYADFYDRLYSSYVRQRFGTAAHVVERHDFLEECRRGVLLSVTRESDVLGAALLRPIGRTMAVLWSALDSARGPGELRGVTDALDYFSLLYAHLQRSRWLDLGPSRPDLCDGIFRYKAKWGAEVYAGLVPQPRISMACKGETAAQRHFLQRHVYLVRENEGFRALAFAAGDTDAEALGRRLGSLLVPGVLGYRVVTLSTPREQLREVLAGMPGVELVDGSQFADVTAAAVGSRAR